MIQTPKPTGSAQGVSWNLNDLYSGPADPRIEADLESARSRAAAFDAAYRGKIAVEGGPSADLLAAALTEYEGIAEQRDKPAVYAGLLFAAKTDNPVAGALKTRTMEAGTAISKHLIFFDLEWVKLADGPASALIGSPKLAKYKHYLSAKRAWTPYKLSEPEEKILDEKSLTGWSAFERLFDETVPAIRCLFAHGGKTEMLSVQQILPKLYDPDRSVRVAGHAGLTKGLQDNARLLTFILNTIVADHKSDCDLRKYPSPMTQRNLSNEISPEVVDALMTAAERFHPTVQRYYRLKRRLLGLDVLYDYDRYAAISGQTPTMEWSAARKVVSESYHAFSPKAGTIVDEFFEKRWIDAEVRDGKRGGAFSSGGVPSVHPYILMSFTDKLRDVMTLAHELGHGVHQYLSRRVGYLECGTPLTTAETASVFGEMLTFRRLLELYSDPQVRLALLCSKIEDAFATVFRQVVLTRFEQSVHKARREKGEQTTEQINALWLAANKPMHGDAVQLTEGYGWWWSYIGHFIHSPFYCYAYAFGELLVLALVQKYKQEGEAFVPKYLEMLSAGGSEAPHALVAKLGMDVTDPGFWELGLKLLDGMVTEAEEAAAKL